MAGVTSTDATTHGPDDTAGPGRISYERTDFGTTAAGEPVDQWVMDDGTLRLGVLTYGATIRTLEVPAGTGGDRVDVVLGFDDVAGYEQTTAFIGALVGRLANRLSNARFTLDSTTYEIAANEGANALHGGTDGFNRRIWSAEPIDGGLRLSLTSPAGDQGFPGRLEVTVDYLLLPGGTLRLRYAATTDAPTVVNLTQHAYFNLAGGAGGSPVPTLDGHTLQVGSGHYTPVDPALLPSGEIAHVTGTPMDLRTPQSLDFLNLDHNLVLDEEPEETGHGHGHGSAQAEDGLPAQHFAARLRHEASGRTMTVTTSEPAVQVYTGGKLDGSQTGKSGALHAAGAGVCLETQGFPDAPNHADFPSVVLRPGEQYLTVTDWAFSS